jgi:WS/DGAT/MGAT family acyltransferase
VDFDEDTEPHARHVFHSDREPTLAELYSRALVHNVERLPGFARFSLGTARRIASLGAEAMTRFSGQGDRGFIGNVRSLLTGDLAALLPRMPPQTRFSGNVSAHRVFEVVELPLADFRKVRKVVPKATVNDQFLCIVGGALHAYLSSRNELPDSSMIAMVPMTLRGAEKGADTGNQVGFTVMPVHSEIEDPLERLRAICDAAETAKRVTDAVGKEIARDLLETLPSIVADPLLRNVQVPRIGLIVSNVRGPDVPLYLAGAQLVNYLPISIALDGMGLNVTGFSYAGTMRLCAISCREMLPDPAFFAECMQSAFDRLQESAAREAAFTVAEAAALPAAGSDGTRTLEGRVARRPARARKAAKSSRRKPRKRAAP